MDSKNNIDKNDFRSFGFILGSIFALVGLWPLIVRGQPVRFWAFAISTVLAVPALLFPSALKWPYKVWMNMGLILGRLNTRLIMGIVFYFVFTPFGFIARLFGYSPIERHFDRSVETYKVIVKPRHAKHMKQQF